MEDIQGVVKSWLVTIVQATELQTSVFDVDEFEVIAQYIETHFQLW